MASVKQTYDDQNLGMKVRYNKQGILCSKLDEVTPEAEEKLLQAALFADDLVLLAPSEHQLQVMIDTFTEVANKFGQLVSEKKTEVMVSTYGHANGVEQPKLKVTLTQDGITKVLNQVQSFKYLGSRLTSDATMDNEINVRAGRMWAAYHKYEKTVFNQPHVPL